LRSRRRSPASCPDQSVVTETSRRWLEANQSKDLEKVVALHDPEAILLAPGKPAALGREAIREHFRAEFASGWRLLDLRSQVTSCQLSGDLAVATADNEGRVEGPDKAAVAFASKMLTVYRRGEDGKWRLYRDTWNARPAPAGGGKP
jgi:uncharacterized protein (TIGR02246 family)